MTVPSPIALSSAASVAKARKTRTTKRHGALSAATMSAIATASAHRDARDPPRAHGGPDRRGQLARIAGRPHHQVSDALIRLRRRHVRVETHVVETAIPHVVDDSHHGLPDQALAPSGAPIRHVEQALANRVEAWPEASRRLLAHDHDPGRLEAVGRQKAAAAHDLDAHRLEVARRHRLQVVMRVQAPRRRVLWHLSRKQRLVVQPDRAAERAQIDGADRGDAGQRGDARLDVCVGAIPAVEVVAVWAPPRRQAGDRARSRGPCDRGREPCARTAPCRPAASAPARLAPSPRAVARTARAACPSSPARGPAPTARRAGPRRWRARDRRRAPSETPRRPQRRARGHRAGSPCRVAARRPAPGAAGRAPTPGTRRRRRPAAAVVISTLSAMDCRTRWPWRAPSASRTASARSRRAARDTCRPATLAHATSSISAAPPSSVHSTGSAGPSRYD